MDFALGIYLWFTYIVTFKECSKSCISEVCRRMGLDQAGAQETPFVVGTLQPDVEVVPAFQVRAGACCTTLRCLWRGVQCSWEFLWVWWFLFGIFTPWWKLQNSTGFGTSLWEGRASSVHITRARSTAACRVCSCLALCWGERGSSPAEGRGQGKIIHIWLCIKRAGPCGSTAFLQDQRLTGAGRASVRPSASSAGGGSWCWPSQAPCMARRVLGTAVMWEMLGRSKWQILLALLVTHHGAVRMIHRLPIQARVALGSLWFLGSEWPLLGPARGRRRKDEGLRCRTLLAAGPSFVCSRSWK